MFRLVWPAFLIVIVIHTGVFGAPAVNNQGPGTGDLLSSDESEPLIPAWELRKLACHDAGNFYLPISCAGFPAYGNYSGAYRDPETDLPLNSGIFPRDSRRQYIFSAGLWVGGIVDGDTLVSTAYDSWWSYAYEFWPPDPVRGGLRRSGNFADDEFIAVYTDTVVGWPYNYLSNPYDDTFHIPLGIEVRQTSYSWRDTLYDDFVIIDFTVTNIRKQFIQDGWAGITVDPDIYFDDFSLYPTGYTDDASGVLDTVFDAEDGGGRIVIAYCYDIDGDPGPRGWDTASIPGVVSLALLSSSFSNPTVNFNWWISDLNVARDFGPRRVGTPDDPFRPFAGDGLGTAHRQQDKYYLMSHPEKDYNQIEIDTHDSADGWIPSAIPFGDRLHDTKFLLSFGPFDLAPGDSVTFAVALVGAEPFHIGASDYKNYFDPADPGPYQNRLDFTQLMINHRRADSVYRSGLTLPRPGPPAGLHVVDYEDGYITLSWNRIASPALGGYYVSVRDTVYDKLWRRAHDRLLHDTVFVFKVQTPDHEYSFAVSAVDAAGRESVRSYTVTCIPGTPDPPCDLAVMLDGMIPVISWLPSDDTSMVVYMVYRSIWEEPYVLYDSVSGLMYRDLGAESGVQYNYRITAKNGLELESSPAGPVSAMPMARDKGVLFYDLNYDQGVRVDAYHRRYVDRLVDAVRPSIPLDYYDIESGVLPLKRMADYSVIIFDSEKRGGKIPDICLDSIHLYMAHGGKGLFISPNASSGEVGMARLRLSIFETGDFFHDFLWLDSAVTNAFVLRDDAMMGDLMGCQSQTPDYPALEADIEKLATSPIPIEGYLPLSGFIYPRDGAECLYRYQSLYPDSLFHNQVNGIKYVSDTFSIVLFNFPLSLMKSPDNLMAFRRALTDLGVNVTCGDVNDDGRLDIGDAVALLAYLFGDEKPLVELTRSDVDCSGEVNLGDALIIINAIFRGGFDLRCCP